jgi:V/A-type H+-transporting ATPase subunit A
VDAARIDTAREILRRGTEVGQMMKVVGEEGTSIDDFVLHLKAEYLDAAYLQQDAFDAVDGASPAERQQHVFTVLCGVLETPMRFEDKEAARRFFHQLTQTTKDWNRIDMAAGEFKSAQEKLESMVTEVKANA